MKRITLSLSVIVALTILSFTSRAQTNVSGGIHVNTTWTLANSPYIVVDTVVVFPGITLTIQPGVVVKFNNTMQLEIRQATLITNGTSANPITFTSNSSSPTPGIWESIYLNQCVSAGFNYCNFSYSKYGIANSSTLQISIKNSNFTFNTNGIYQCFINMDSCVFKHNTNGINTAMGPGKILNSIFTNNQSGLLNNYGSKTINCIFNSNQTGITISGYRVLIKNCVVDSNTTLGVSLPPSGNYDTIFNNQIKYNGIGLESAAASSGAIITKNVFDNNNIGIKESNNVDSIYCNRICNSTSYAFYYNANSNYNAYLGNNYFCTPDSISTAAVVYDGYDNINYGLVNFMPLDTTNCYQTGCNLHVSANITSATCRTCPNGSAIAHVLYGFPPYTYTWYSTPIQNTQTAIGLASGNYGICVTDANGCSACDTIFVDSTNCTGFSIVPNSTNASCTTCADGTAKVIPTGGTAPYHYTWYTSPMQTTDSISGLIHGTYHVCVTDANGCISCDSTTVNVGSCSAHYNLYSTATPHYYTAVNMASGAAPLTYYWSWGDGTHDTAAYPSHTYAATGFYNICLTITDNAGCTNTYCSSYYLLRPQSQMVYVNVISNTTVGINQLIADNSISIYPNPFTSQTTISFSTEQTNTSIKITDVVGKEIKTINFTGTQYILEKGIMKPGIYFVQITDANKNVVNRKIIIND